jgi:hypothetical protein
MPQMDIEIKGSRIIVNGVPVRIPQRATLDESDLKRGEVCFFFLDSYVTLRFRPEPPSSNCGTFALTVEAAHPEMEEIEATLPMLACEFLEGTGDARLSRFLRAVCAPVRKGGSR